MLDSSQDSSPVAARGAEKRAFARNAIYLEGWCSIAGRAPFGVEILDFCPGGALLSYGRRDRGIPPSIPAQDDRVEIRCSVPTAGGEQPLLLHGRVARIDSSSFGVAFITPSFDALHMLHEYARTHRSPPQQRAAESPQEGTPAPAPTLPGNLAPQVLRECGAIIEERLEPLAKAFLEQCTERLLALAGEARGIAEKNLYYGAVTAFNKDGKIFRDEFLARMRDGLRHPPARTGIEPKSAAGKGGAGLTLSLVEEDAFEDWLTFTDISRAAELEHQDRLVELEQRVGALLQRPIGKEDNPFGPGVFSRAFQGALAALALDRKAVPASGKVFKDLLVAQLGEIYDRLNRHLIERGVLPNLKPSDYLKTPSATTRHGAAMRSDAVPNAMAAAPSATLPDNGAHATANALSTEISKFPAGWSGAGNPTPDQGARTGHAPVDWYDLVKGLGSLQEFISQHTVQRRDAPQETVAETPGSAPAAQPPAPLYTAEELMLALSRVNREARSQPLSANFQQDLKSRLQAALSNAAQSPEPRELPGRERNIVDLGGNFFESILADRLVATTVKPWLQQLSVPMIRMAINDDSLFFDKSHLARQLINRIAELELYGEDNKGENIVSRKVDAILDEITRTENVTPELIQKMLREVGVLVYLQNKAYEENIKEVLAACPAEEQQAADAPATVAADSIAAKTGERRLPESAPDGDSLLEYWKRVRRLKVGSWLMLETAAGIQKLRLVWIGKNFDNFVFVNVKGQKEANLTQTELARQMKSGAAVVLDDGGDPLVDRAQSAMLQKMHLQLLHETTHDRLTGLINRREFEKHLEEALARTRQHGRKSTVCYLDLDQFNVVNSTFGYDGGDRLLLEITQLLQAELGDLGVLAHIGGDEFAILLENFEVEDALGVLAQQKEALQRYRFSADGKSLAVSFSSGVVAIEPGSESATALLQAAEASCRIARAKGTNQVQVYRPDEATVSHHMKAMQWVARIDETLDKDELELRCQPIVSIGGRTVSVHQSEVLIGLPDDHGKLMSPEDFIAAAEHFQRMPSVDRWVIVHAFRWMADRRDRLTELGGLAIKLSGASLNEEGLIDFVVQQADKLRIPMDKVCFEITESAGIAQLSATTEFILALKRTGCTFCLDDFGRGLSSYAFLKNLPVDYLKIDGTFVKNMDQNPNDCAVVKSITDICHFMGKKIIAECVESETVLKMLREIGVDFAQGYYTGKPRKLKVLGS